MEKSVKDQPEVSAEAITRKMICYGLFTVPVTILSLLLLILIIYFGKLMMHFKLSTYIQGINFRTCMHVPYNYMSI